MAGEALKRLCNIAICAILFTKKETERRGYVRRSQLQPNQDVRQSIQAFWVGSEPQQPAGT